MKIFVTGATGVVGRRLVPLLIQKGHKVTAVARSAEGQKRMADDGAAPVNISLFDTGAVVRAVSGHDMVINLATHIPSSSTKIFLPWAWKENDRVRRLASRILVEASIAANVSRFIQESFAPVYPSHGEDWIDETIPIQPVRYNRTVMDAEAATDRFTRTGRTGIVLRFGAFYGPDSNMTGEMIATIRKGWAPLPGPRDAYISSVSHDDAATAVVAAISLPAGFYNVVDDEPVTHQVFMESLADALGVAHPKFLPRWIEPFFGSLGKMMARSLRISNRKLRAWSTWAPRYASVREGWPAVIAGRGEMPHYVPVGGTARG